MLSTEVWEWRLDPQYPHQIWVAMTASLQSPVAVCEGRDGEWLDKLVSQAVPNDEPWA